MTASQCEFDWHISTCYQHLVSWTHTHVSACYPHLVSLMSSFDMHRITLIIIIIMHITIEAGLDTAGIMWHHQWRARSLTGRTHRESITVWVLLTHQNAMIHCHHHISCELDRHIRLRSAIVEYSRMNVPSLSSGCEIAQFFVRYMGAQCAIIILWVRQHVACQSSFTSSVWRTKLRNFAHPWLNEGLSYVSTQKSGQFYTFSLRWKSPYTGTSNASTSSTDVYALWIVYLVCGMVGSRTYTSIDTSLYIILFKSYW